MLYTLTLNPAIDLFIDTNKLEPNTVNRTNGFDIQANGKGVNVSFILKRLGLNNTAWGVGGGFTLHYIEETLSQANISNHFIHIDGITRINVFTHVRTTEQEFKQVNPGPTVDLQHQQQLLTEISQLTPADWLIISGSFSKGIDPKILLKIGALAQKNHFKLIIDTSYPEVRQTLTYHPLLIKPNDEELKSWFGITDDLSQADLIKLAQRLLPEGAQNILLSLGGNGALLVTPEAVYHGNAPKVDVLNTAGAGDTMLGTFVAGLVQGKDPADNLRFAIAAGSDTARKSWITDFKQVDALLNQIKVTKV